MAEPLLIIVTGVPASGKSTLAVQFSERLGLPLFGKDQIKEVLFDTLGIGDRTWSRKLGAASNELLYQLVENQLRVGRSCIVESNFDPQYATERFLGLHERIRFRCVQVVCTATAHVLQQRFQARSRHPGHLDHVLTDELQAQFSENLGIAMSLPGQVRMVDTTDLTALPAMIEHLIEQLIQLASA